MTLEEFVTRGMMAQTEADKLCRTTDPQTSKDVAKHMVDSGKLNKQEQLVFGAISDYLYWDYGIDFTTKDIPRAMRYYNYDKAYDICRRRFSGLYNKFKICLTGERRDNCRVWKLL